jgi:hypothetical protein
MNTPKNYLLEIKQWFTALQKVQRDYVAFRILSLLPASSVTTANTSQQENAEVEVLQMLHNYIDFDMNVFPFEYTEKQIGLSLCLINIIDFILFTYESEDFLLDLHNKPSVMPEYIKKQLLIDNPATQDVLYALFSSRKQALASWQLLTHEGGVLNLTSLMNKYANS